MAIKKSFGISQMKMLWGTVYTSLYNKMVVHCTFLSKLMR